MAKKINNTDPNNVTYATTCYYGANSGHQENANDLDECEEYVAEYKLVRIARVVRPANVKLETVK